MGGKSKKKWNNLSSNWGLFTNEVNMNFQWEKKESNISNPTSIVKPETEQPIKEEKLSLEQDNSIKKREESETTYYLIFNKRQIYSFLRKWYISSWLESSENNPIKKERFVDNWCLRLFKKNNLPEIEDEILVRLELKLNNKYTIKNEKWETIWIIWFLPITTVTWIIFKNDWQKEDFENPVPNMNDNFVIPNELCFVDEEIYRKCVNPFNKIDLNSLEKSDEIIESINHYSRLLWWLFFANYNVYLNDNIDSYSDQYIKFLQEIFNELEEDIKNPESSSYNIMLNLAYTWKLSIIESVDDLCRLLLDEHVINISDYLYIKKSYKTTIWWLSNFEEFFEYKSNNTDNITWQIISFLFRLCSNKSLEERSIDLSNFLGWWNKIINPKVTFILWMCCTFNNIVSEFSWNNSEIMTKRKMKELFTPIREKILNDVYDFIVNNKSLNKWPEPEVGDSTSEKDKKWLIIIKKNFSLLWENYSITRKLTIKDAYLIKIRQVYWKDFEWIHKWTYLMSFLLKNNYKNLPENDIENMILSYLEANPNKNEELEQIIDLDQRFN